MVTVLVSAYDIYVSIAHQNSLYDYELNPMGRWLIQADGGSVALFMSLKFAGTVLALFIMTGLYFIARRIAVLASASVGLLMVGLFLYLSFA